jgi:hypothetical protein
VTENLNLGHDFVTGRLIRQLEFIGFVTARAGHGTGRASGMRE